MQRRRILIVGGVAAGPAAAAEARRTDPDAEIVLFEEGRDVSYGACELPYLVSGRIGDADAIVRLRPEELARTRGITVRTLNRVERIRPADRRITVRDLATGSSTVERYDALVLATGARARTDGVGDLPGPDAYVLRTLDDGVRLADASRRNRGGHVVVLGAGFVGLETACELAASGHRITVLDPNGPLGSHLDPPMVALLDEALLVAGVAVRRERATHVRRHAVSAPVAVATSGRELVGARFVVAALGLVPTTGLGTDAGIRTGPSGAYRVDETMRTSVRGIYACGDCAETRCLPDGRSAYVPLSPAAFRGGRVAGHNAARHGRGPARALRSQAAAYAGHLAGLEVASVGLTARTAQGLDAGRVQIRHVSASERHGASVPLHVALVFERGSGRVLGGQLLGRHGAAQRANVLVALLHAGGTVSDLQDFDLVYAPPVAPALDPLIVAAHAAQKALGRR